MSPRSEAQLGNSNQVRSLRQAGRGAEGKKEVEEEAGVFLTEVLELLEEVRTVSLESRRESASQVVSYNSLVAPGRTMSLTNPET